jgi:hypothetical protein
MKRTILLFSAAASIMLAGCQTSPSPSAPATPTTVPVAQSPVTPPASPPPSPAQPAPPPTPQIAVQGTQPPPVASTLPPLKDMTHSFTKDTPYFASKPAKGAAPDGTFKAGTKVIVLIPGAPYCKVLSQDGVTAYASIDDLEPLSNK